MYIGPTSVYFDNKCMLLCIIPLLTTAMLECRLFAYFLLMKERLRIINKSIEFYTNNLHSLSNTESHNDDRMDGIRKKIFFITELGSKKINDRVMTKKTVNGAAWKSNFVEKLKPTMWSLWRFVKNLINVRKNKIFVDNFDAAYKNAVAKNNCHPDRCIKLVCSMQIIYSKLHEISDLISKAYGIQIIAIISVQFVTLTTLMYYTTMKIIRWVLVNELLCHRCGVEFLECQLQLYIWKGGTTGNSELPHNIWFPSSTCKMTNNSQNSVFSDICLYFHFHFESFNLASSPETPLNPFSPLFSPYCQMFSGIPASHHQILIMTMTK